MYPAEVLYPEPEKSSLPPPNLFLLYTFQIVLILVESKLETRRDHFQMRISAIHSVLYVTDLERNIIIAFSRNIYAMNVTGF
jgi:hypothetical protein